MNSGNVNFRVQQKYMSLLIDIMVKSSVGKILQSKIRNAFRSLKKSCYFFHQKIHIQVFPYHPSKCLHK